LHLFGPQPAVQLDRGPCEVHRDRGGERAEAAFALPVALDTPRSRAAVKDLGIGEERRRRPAPPSPREGRGVASFEIEGREVGGPGGGGECEGENERKRRDPCHRHPPLDRRGPSGRVTSASGTTGPGGFPAPELSMIYTKAEANSFTRLR